MHQGGPFSEGWMGDENLINNFMWPNAKQYTKHVGVNFNI